VGRTQVAVDDRLERPSATSAGRAHSHLTSLSQGALHRGADQIISGFEMSVEAAVCQAGFLHQLRYSDTVDAITAYSGRSDVDDSIVARRLVSLRTTHEWTSGRCDISLLPTIIAVILLRRMSPPQSWRDAGR
jgi:N-acyl-L-homoserine lactone synthetase